MAVQLITGSSQAGLANVSATYELQVVTPKVELQSGFVRVTSEIDAGTIIGTARTKAFEVSESWRLRTALDTPLMAHVFASSAIDSGMWATPVTTATLTVGGGFVTLNAGLSVASGAVARCSSYRTFPMDPGAGLYFECVAQFAQTPVANNVAEWGFGFATGTAAPTDGAFFRLNAAGEFRGVVNSNGTEIQTGTLNFAALVGANVSKHFIIQTYEDSTLFWIDDILVGVVDRAAAGYLPTAACSWPAFLRTYNSSATGAAQVLKVAYITVTLLDVNTGKPWSNIQAGEGGHCHQGQVGGTMGSTESYANSADPTAAAALSNTATLVTGLGGQFRFNAAAVAVTDGIVTSYQNPVATAALPGKTLYITGVSISTVNLGAAVATTCTTLQWCLAFGHTAVSLATAEASGSSTKAPRRVALGISNWPIAAAIGQQPDKGDIVRRFTTPIPVFPGEFIQTVAKFIQGTATASQVIWGTVTFDGYWE